MKIIVKSITNISMKIIAKLIMKTIMKIIMMIVIMIMQCRNLIHNHEARAGQTTRDSLFLSKT